MRISDWSSDVCSSDLLLPHRLLRSHAVTCCLGLHPLSERAHPRIDEPFLAIDQVVALACRHAEIEGIDERPGGDLRVDVAGVAQEEAVTAYRSEEHTSELQSLMRISYAVFCLTKKTPIRLHKQTER